MATTLKELCLTDPNWHRLCRWFLTRPPLYYSCGPLPPCHFHRHSGNTTCLSPSDACWPSLHAQKVRYMIQADQQINYTSSLLELSEEFGLQSRVTQTGNKRHLFIKKGWLLPNPSWNVREHWGPQPLEGRRFHPGSWFTRSLANSWYLPHSSHSLLRVSHERTTSPPTDMAPSTLYSLWAMKHALSFSACVWKYYTTGQV